MLDWYLNGREDRERCEAREEKYENFGEKSLSTEKNNGKRIEDRAAAPRYSPGEDDAPAIEDSSLRAERIVPIRSSSRIINRYYKKIRKAQKKVTRIRNILG